MIQLILIAGAVVGAFGALAGGVLAFRRLFSRLEVIQEGVLGKPEVTDFSGAVIEPAVPSIQARVASLEELFRNSNNETRISQLEAWREEHTRESDAVVTRMLDHVLRYEDK